MIFRHHKRAVCALALVTVASLVSPLAARAGSVSPEEQTWENRVGQSEYAQYLQHGEILPPGSPAYATLDSVGNAIAAVADQQYYAPFKFYILNEQQPNALAVPGGNVYVTLGMLSLLRTRDQLAGVICHEVNHDIHHDMYTAYRNGGDMPSSEFKRAAEMNADRAGAYTCAQAGFNPWGMVWNFRQYHEMTGSTHAESPDHPSDDQRAAALASLLTSDPHTFGRFRDDIAAATALPRASGQHVYAYGQPPAPTQYPQRGLPPYSPYGSPYPQSGTPPYPPPPLPPCYPGC